MACNVSPTGTGNGGAVVEAVLESVCCTHLSCTVAAPPAPYLEAEDWPRSPRSMAETATWCGCRHRGERPSTCAARNGETGG